MPITQPRRQVMLDTEYPTTGGGDYIAYSANGTAESGVLARTAIGATGWAAATAADPSVKANANALTSAAASGSATISHFAIFSASTGGTQKTTWQALDTSKPVTSGDVITWATGACQVRLA